MENDRIAGLQALLGQEPGNTFARYGLAMEFAKAGQTEAAIEEFQTVIQQDPGYAYAYFHGGRILEQTGRTKEARTMYERGIEVAHGAGDQKALGELQAALDLLPHL